MGLIVLITSLLVGAEVPGDVVVEDPAAGAVGAGGDVGIVDAEGVASGDGASGFIGLICSTGPAPGVSAGLSGTPWSVGPRRRNREHRRGSGTAFITFVEFLKSFAPEIKCDHHKKRRLEKFILIAKY